jgi:hypothetical protein
MASKKSEGVEISVMEVSRGTIEFCICVSETGDMTVVARVKLPVEVSFDYLPPEPHHLIQRADIEVTRVEMGGIDITEGLESDDIEEIVNALWEYTE